MLRVDPEESPDTISEKPAEQHPAWRRVQLARHPKRPHSLDYIERIFTDFQEIHGDRAFGDDPAIVAGMAQFDGRPVMVVAEQKGRDTKQKLLPQFRHAEAGRLPQGAARDATGRQVRPARSLPSWTRRAPTRASTPKSAARPKRSRAICARWRAWRCR